MYLVGGDMVEALLKLEDLQGAENAKERAAFIEKVDELLDSDLEVEPESDATDYLNARIDQHSLTHCIQRLWCAEGPQNAARQGLP